MAVVLALATAAIISLRGQISGIALYRGGVADTVGPTVTINVASGQLDPTNATPILFTAVFSEVVLDFATGDVTLSGTAGASSAIVSGSGTTYTVTVSGMTSDGTVIATILAGVAHDAAANPNSASTSTDNTVTYDTTQPTVTINQAAGQADPTEISPIDFTVIFSQAVTGFGNADVTLSGTAGATTASVTGSGTTYNVAVSGMTLSGTVIATIPEDVAQDTAGNLNVASTSTDNTVTFNIVAPSSPTVVTNLIPNSSFELGTGRGHIAYGNGVSSSYGNETGLVYRLVTTNSVHGSNSAGILTRWFAPPRYLTNGTYTYTFYASSPQGSLFVNHGLMAASNLGDVPGTSASIGTAWQRVTNTVVVPSNGVYLIKLYHVQAFPVLLDAVQLEYGSAATAYGPQSPVEAGLDTAVQGHNFFSGDTKQFQVNLYNNGALTNVTVGYNIYNLWNSNVASGFVTTNALAANTNTTINVNLPTLNGWMRIVSYVTNINDSWDELAVSVFPMVFSSSKNTNTTMGLHTHWSPWHMNNVRRSGYNLVRVSSPISEARWTSVQPSRLVTNFPDTVMTAITNSSLVAIVSLTAGLDFTWTEWATNADGTADIPAYVNYCGAMVARYPTVWGWQVWNEAQNVTPVIDLSQGTNYANLFTNAARRIKTVNPNAIVYGMSGFAGADMAWDAWTNLTAIGKADLDVIDFHLYPQDNSGNMNDPEDDYSHFSSIWRAWSYFGTNKPIANTETGTFGAGGQKTKNVLLNFPYFPLYGTFSPESLRNDTMARHLTSTDRVTQNLLRSLGWGFTNYFYYYGKDNSADDFFSATTPTVWELNDSLVPHASAALMAKRFTGVGLGRVTNVNNANIEAYLFTNSLGSIVAMWNLDRANRTLTLGSANYAAYDTAGNQIQTNVAAVFTGRSVCYLVSGTLTTIQLRNAVSNATVAAASDTFPPGVSLDISPLGVIESGRSNLFKWHATDETKQVWYGTASDQTNILYKWRFDTGAYTTYSQSNHVWQSFSTPGSYNLRVVAKDFSNNESVESVGPTFTVP